MLVEDAAIGTQEGVLDGAEDALAEAADVEDLAAGERVGVVTIGLQGES